MYETDVAATLKSARAKLDFFKANPGGFFLASMLAGMFITFGSMVSMSVGGYATPLLGAAAKLPAAVAFAAALSMVITAGCELFTGNNLTVGMLGLSNARAWGRVLALWAFCWLGNLAGSWLTIALYHYSGADAAAPVSGYFAQVAAGKVALAPLQMVLRGVLCNILVCLAVWCAFRLKSECARLVMTFWCILVFMICGFEHSIANMSIIGVALLDPAASAVSLAGYAVNLGLVTLGNALGAVLFLALPYRLMAHDAA